MKDIILRLSQLCDEIIIKKINILKSIGVKVKEMTALGESEESILERHKEMAIIFDELLPFEQRVRYLYPELNTLFDLLKNCIVTPKN